MEAIEAWAVLALAALTLLPGALVVRAPLVIKPFLSHAFWIVTWWWMGPLATGRERFLHAVLAGSIVLLLVRMTTVLRDGPAPARWSFPVVAPVLAATALAFVPHLAWPVAPGASAAAEAEATVLLSWHDGVPRAASPLADGPFPPAHVAAGGIAADLVLLTRVASHRAASAASCIASLLLGAGVFIALRPRFARRSMPLAIAAVTAVLGFVSLGSGTRLAVGFAGAALAVTHRSTSAPAAAAAGLLIAASIVSDPSAGLACGVALLLSLRRRPAALVPAAVAAVLALAPFALRLVTGTIALPPHTTVGWWTAPPLAAGDVAELAALRTAAAPLARVCHDGTTRAAWIQAIAARRVSSMPECDWLYRDRCRDGHGVGGCTRIQFLR